MPFFQVNFHKYDKICQILCIVSHAKTCFFLKSVKQKSKRSNDKRSNDKKCREEKHTNLTLQLQNKMTQKTRQKMLILENAMPKVITEIYFELWVSHSNFVKIVLILIHCIASAVFVYISFPSSTKSFCHDFYHNNI